MFAGSEEGLHQLLCPAIPEILHNVVILNEQTGQVIIQPGRVSSEEQQLVEKLQWEIESCTEQSTVLQAEIKTTKELIEKKKRNLKS
jgi:hypothetical protein